MDEILGVVYDVLLDKREEPLEEASYQSIVSPEDGVAEIATVPVPQREAFPAVGAEGFALTVNVTVALFVVPHPLVAVYLIFFPLSAKATV